MTRAAALAAVASSAAAGVVVLVVAEVFAGLARVFVLIAAVAVGAVAPFVVFFVRRPSAAASVDGPAPAGARSVGALGLASLGGVRVLAGAFGPFADSRGLSVQGAQGYSLG